RNACHSRGAGAGRPGLVTTYGPSRLRRRPGSCPRLAAFSSSSCPRRAKKPKHSARGCGTRAMSKDAMWHPDLVARKVDVIVVDTTQAIQAAQRATSAAILKDALPKVTRVAREPQGGRAFACNRAERRERANAGGHRTDPTPTRCSWSTARL